MKRPAWISVFVGPAPHEIDDLVAHVGRRPCFGLEFPKAFF